MYDLRSTLASNALAAGVTVYELARMMGTSVGMIEAHYGALLDTAHDSLLTRLDVSGSTVTYSNNFDLDLTDDFPVANLEALHRYLADRRQGNTEIGEAWPDYSVATNGLLYRFRAADEGPCTNVYVARGEQLTTAAGEVISKSATCSGSSSKV